MNRRNFLKTTAGLIAIGLTRQFVSAAEPAAPTSAPAMFSAKLEPVRLEDNLYALIGGGGNNAVHFDADRLLVIDTGIPQRGGDILDAAMKMNPGASKKTLFNTHWHFDHTGGNAAFSKAGFDIIGSANCRARLGQTINFEDLGMTAEPLPEAARPSTTFDESLKLYSPTPITLTKVAAAHTDTDAIAFFEKYNILHTGDLVFVGGFPVIDRSTGGSLDGMIAASKHLLTLGDGKTRVIPGHGPLGDKSIIQAQLDLLNQVHDRLAPFGAKKTSMEEVLAAKPLADLDEKWGRGFLRSPIFTKMAYGQWLTK